MRLLELFSEINEKSIGAVERDLDARDYQPADKVQAGKPVIDLDLSSPHFIQRLAQRGKSAGITPEEVEELLHNGREKFKAEIGQASKTDSVSPSVAFYDQDSKLMVPTIAVPNPACKPGSRGKFTCNTVNGPAPKNKLVAKTIVRKGTPD
jgi:hypothetical protein